MDQDLNKILKTLGVEEGNYYISNDGRVKKRGTLSDEDTGIYQTENGEFKKVGVFFDENTGLKQNERGEFKEEGFLFDKDTGIYQDKDGNYKKKGLLIDEKTGYYKDSKGNIKKEGFFGRSYQAKAHSSSSTNYSPPKDDETVLINFLMWILLPLIIIACAVLVIFYAVIIAIFLAPIILLAWYLINKREMQWLAILGMCFSVYVIYDITSVGLVSNAILNLQQNDDGKYLSLGYFIIFITTLGFYIDKYTSVKIPLNIDGNFFEQKNIKERRPFIAGLGFLMVTLFGLTQFMFIPKSKSNQNVQDEVVNNIKNQQNIENQVPATNQAVLSINKAAYIKANPSGVVRSASSTSANIVESLDKGENIYIIERDEATQWYKINYGNNQYGYVSSDIISYDFVQKNDINNEINSDAEEEVKNAKVETGTSNYLTSSGFYGRWNIDNDNSTYLFNSNYTGVYSNNRGRETPFTWSFDKNNLRIVQSTDNSVWNWKIVSNAADVIQMYSAKNKLSRKITKR
jgi:uncharacterized protein YgiM (DUF1202 family)